MAFSFSAYCVHLPAHFLLAKLYEVSAILMPLLQSRTERPRKLWPCLGLPSRVRPWNQGLEAVQSTRPRPPTQDPHLPESSAGPKTGRGRPERAPPRTGRAGSLRADNGRWELHCPKSFQLPGRRIPPPGTRLPRSAPRAEPTPERDFSRLLGVRDTNRQYLRAYKTTLPRSLRDCARSRSIARTAWAF